MIRPRTLLLILAAAVALAAALVQPHQAVAHALLARSDPPINAALRESPTRITLFMTEPLQQNYSGVTVLDSGGQRRDIGATEFSDANATQMSIRVLRLEAGVYTVVWRTLSQVDGHTWNGSYVFSVLHPDGSAPAGTGVAVDLSRPGPPPAADAAVKAIGLAALVLFVGALFTALVLRPGSEPILIPILGAAALLGILTTGYEAVAAALRLGGLEFLDEALFDTRNGLWLQARAAALIAIAGVLFLQSPLSPRLPLLSPRLRGEMSRSDRGGSPRPTQTLALLALAWLAATSAVSHGAALDAGGVWGALFDAIHLGAAAIWIGGLAAVLLILRRWPQERIAVVRRFSIAAAISVPILAAAGLLSALIQIPAARGLIDTDWGVAFLIKVAVLAALFSAAAVNAFVLRPRDTAAGGDDPTLERRFKRLMRVEVLLGLAAIAATAALTQLPSPASVLPDSEQKDNTIVETVARADVVAQLQISPNLVGFNEWKVRLTDAEGEPLRNAVEDLLLRFRYEDEAVGPVVVPATRVGDGEFELDGAYFGLPGRWTIELELRRASGDDLIAAITTEVESGYQTVAPFETAPPGALALPLTQMDWNGIGALWAFVLGGLAWINRPHLRASFGSRGGDGAFVAGLLGIIVGVVLLTGLHVEPGRTLANPVALTQESVERGGGLFATHCASCHGETGAGDGPLADTLPAPPANFTVHVPFHPDGVLYAWISDGIRGTGMPAWAGQLSEQERWDLVNYLRRNFDPAALRSSDLD